MARYGPDPEAVAARLGEVGYVADRTLATALALAVTLDRPLLLEGPAGVGKTSLAEAWAKATQARLHRLSCYEGLGREEALYDWDYGRQILAVRLAESRGEAERLRTGDLYGDEYLLERPLLRALRGRAGEPAPVLLVDEVDRADAAFEAFLLETLAEWGVTIPERGETVRAEVAPVAILTSNRTRELSDALRRRCLYAYVDYPAQDQEEAIVRANVPGLGVALARQVVAIMARLRSLPLLRVPGTAETLDLCRALVALGANEVTPERMRDLLGTVLKSEEDLRLASEGDLAALIAP
ncbi:MAG: MoxR family ATPase [Firmicutes bacterium]|nr:MoxR family ATPase [Bacillota bacterium]